MRSCGQIALGAGVAVVSAYVFLHVGISVGVSLTLALCLPIGGCLTVKALRTSLNPRQPTERKLGFYSHLHHELRSPINAVMGLSEALALGVYGGLGDAKQHPVELIHLSGERLLSLVDTTISYLKTEAGEVSADMQRTPTRILLESIVAGKRRRVGNEKTDIRLHMPEDLPDAHTDTEHVETIVSCLIDNAIRGAHPGTSVIVDVSHHEALEKISIAVTNVGHPVPAGEAKRVFEPFYRASSEDGGSHNFGLGLALSRGLAEVIDADLNLEESKPERTTIALTIAAYTAEDFHGG